MCTSAEDQVDPVDGRGLAEGLEIPDPRLGVLPARGEAGVGVAALGGEADSAVRRGFVEVGNA